VPLQTLRIIDATCNRISEGLRFLEDVARFLLNDANLSRQFKAMRHSLSKKLSKFGTDLLSVRNSAGDVGAGIELSQQQDLTSLVIANAKRAEEGLRVIEELAKLPEISHISRSKDFEQIRFHLYTLERELLSKVVRREKITRLTGIYVIIDTQTLGFEGEVKAASKAIHGGARIIQLRDKHYNKGALLTIAKEIKNLCQKSSALFIINDHLDIALAADADGLHIGQEDLPLSIARKELPIDKIIGCSTTDITQALKAQAEGADYVAAGSIFPSTTKGNANVIGIEQLQQIKQAISIPVVAIGGINKDNIVQVIAAGADSAAVISAVLNQESIEQATRQLVKEIEQGKNSHRKSRGYR
jgi:thiamine-phosphate pyrophosphorylase